MCCFSSKYRFGDNTENLVTRMDLMNYARILFRFPSHYDTSRSIGPPFVLQGTNTAIHAQSFRYIGTRVPDAEENLRIHL